jgi:predicted aconitase
MLQLASIDREMLSGSRGPGAQFAMEMLVAVAEMYEAQRFIDIEWAHVASAYCQGRANIDLATKFAEWNTRVAVPTTLTTCSLDLNVPVEQKGPAVELIRIYQDMGCEAVMTCAPYHARPEPPAGAHLAWCESSAVIYANSVLGARTNRYVEFIDICAAITGRVPECGLHRDENRRATLVFNVGALPPELFNDAWVFHALGILIAERSGAAIPAIIGIPRNVEREHLRAMGSAAAGSGSVSMFHAVGITPGAPTLETACGGNVPAEVIDVGIADIERCAASLSTGSDAAVTAVCVGSPHMSVEEFGALVNCLAGRRVSSNVTCVASTSAAVLREIERLGLLGTLTKAGVRMVTGRCTYYRPFAMDLGGHVMTNSAKWAWYAPSNLGVDVTFASLSDCVEKAVKSG